eukprot:sb/3464810/
MRMSVSQYTENIEPTDSSKQPIRTRYLDHLSSYQPIRDQYFRSEEAVSLGPRFSALLFSDTPIYAHPDLVTKNLSPEDVTKWGSDCITFLHIGNEITPPRERPGGREHVGVIISLVQWEKNSCVQTTKQKSEKIPKDWNFMTIYGSTCYTVVVKHVRMCSQTVTFCKMQVLVTIQTSAIRFRLVLDHGIVTPICNIRGDFVTKVPAGFNVYGYISYLLDNSVWTTETNIKRGNTCYVLTPFYKICYGVSEVIRYPDIITSSHEEGTKQEPTESGNTVPDWLIISHRRTWGRGNQCRGLQLGQKLGQFSARRGLSVHPQMLGGCQIHLLRFKRLDLRFLEIKARSVYLLKGDPQFPGISAYISILLEVILCTGKLLNIGNRMTQPIRTRYLGHVTGYQPIGDQYFLIWSVIVNLMNLMNLLAEPKEALARITKDAEG